jgi:hypothetical protein
MLDMENIMVGGRIGLIIKATGCNQLEAEEVEDIMRDVIFRSTLDWQSEDELVAGARKAIEVLRALKNDDAETPQ